MASSRVAIVYETTDDGQVVAGRIFIERGKLIGEPASDPTVDFILGRSLVRRDTGEVVSPQGDPQRFLEALPAGYTGTRVRVGLTTETTKRMAPGRVAARPRAHGPSPLPKEKR